MEVEVSRGTRDGASTSFVAGLIQHADGEPDRPALTIGARTMTRADFVEEVARTAAALRDRGVGVGSVVANQLPNSLEAVVVSFAAWWLGATPMPLNARLPVPERAALLDLARPALVIEREGQLGGRAAGVSLAATDTVSPCWKVVPSGGSTGRPKLIVSEEPATLEAVRPYVETLHIGLSETVLVTAPLSHNAPFIIAALSILQGSHVVLVDRFSPVRTLKLVERHHVTWLYLVPTMMRRIARLPETDRSAHDLTSLRIVYHMSAPCPSALKRQWIEWLGAGRIWELYAGTEMQAVATISGEEWLDKPGSVGRAAIGEFTVSGADGRRGAVDEAGTIWLRRAPGVVPYRYLGADLDVADDGWTTLGDIGTIDRDGYLFISDRSTAILLVGGANVYPSEIEAALSEHPDVESSCVIGLPDADLGEVPHAIVHLVPGSPVTDEQIIEHVRARLAPYKVPRSVERVQESLFDAAGKVRREALRAKRLDQPMESSLPPQATR